MRQLHVCSADESHECYKDCSNWISYFSACSIQLELLPFSVHYQPANSYVVDLVLCVLLGQKLGLLLLDLLIDLCSPAGLVTVGLGSVCWLDISLCLLGLLLLFLDSGCVSEGVGN